MWGKPINWSLYAILDKGYQKNHSMATLAEAAIAGGAGVIQLRNKTGNAGVFLKDAFTVKEVTDRYGIPLIINDRVDIAMLVEAAGVHLGQDDLPFAVGRKLLGDEKILGASVHNLIELRQAQKGRPDYLGVGTIYASQTKSRLKHGGLAMLRTVRHETGLPIVAIGGISTTNLQPVIVAGANGVAVISGLFAAEDVRKRAQAFVNQIEQARRQ